MGGCASSQKNLGKKSGKKPTLKVVKVIHMDGRVKEFSPPICAEQILSCNPGCFLCCSDSMFIDSFPTKVPEPEELQPGHFYFLLPKSKANKPLSLEDLCELAIKASSNISIDDVQLSFRHYAVV
ncbi:uncharacterized protein LOC104896186 [Beta vulgaris subsp. vulgaris]|uniref:uncharacterized protein LOC104896186 n=1 Tax=Beta vulgaris subsp. vulgaris TaxID=3555 RepID=UPI002037326B|nr:uncharacterized protein LOC104896186 [Beta vulgaris subsp. vulgaris]